LICSPRPPGSPNSLPTGSTIVQGARRLSAVRPGGLIITKRACRLRYGQDRTEVIETLGPVLSVRVQRRGALGGLRRPRSPPQGALIANDRNRPIAVISV